MNSTKRIIVSLCLLFLLFDSKAQEVVYSRYDHFNYQTDAYTVVGMTGGYLFTYLRNTDAAQLDAYDDSMKKVATIILDFLPSRIYNIRFVTYPDKILVLYQGLESNKVVQYAALLDKFGMLQGKPLELGQTKTGLFGATKTYYLSAVSDDKKHILIYTVKNKNRSIEFEGIWLDDNAAVVKQSNATFKPGNMPQHGEINVANDGTIYMAAFTPVGSQDYADQYWLLKLKPGSETFEAKELNLGEQYAAGGYTKIDNVNNKVYFGGFYSDNKNGNFDGIIYAAYDIAKDAFVTERYLPFDAELSEATRSRRKRNAFDNFIVRQLIVKNDGGFVLVSEIQYITTRNTFTPGFGYYSFYSPYMNSTVREYHYKDIMALAYDKNGKREWSTFIPKNQFSQEDEGVFSSYALLNTGGTLAFLFNDFNSRHSRIQLATVTANGQSEINSLMTDLNDYSDWLPRYAKQVAGRVLIVPCFKKKQICYAKVTF